MSDLFKVAGPAEPSASVLLVHGLGGHAYNTWRRGGGKQSQLDETFWPRWLADDDATLAVYVIGCAAPVSRLRGTAMHLTDQATNVLNRLIRRILRSTIAKSPSPCRTIEQAVNRRGPGGQQNRDALAGRLLIGLRTRVSHLLTPAFAINQ